MVPMDKGTLRCRIKSALPSRIESSQSALRSLVWLALLLAAAAGAWAVLSAHRVRVRGIPRDFPAPVAEADVPPLGVNVALDAYQDHELTSALDRVANGGFTWVRQSFPRSRVEREDASTGFDWTDVDPLMNVLGRYAQLRLVAVLTDDPPTPPAHPEQFAAFARAFAERYGDQVDYYQIWDEPNLATHWGGGPVNPSAYADLLARTARAIRAADPNARILLAGLAPTTETGSQNLSEVRYLERLYQMGAAPYFDIVAAKPYGFDTGPGDRRVDESLLNVSRVLLLRQVMVAHGDAGTAIWASHWGWNALPARWEGAPSIWGQTDPATQAARSVATLERARDEWPWMGAMIIETLQPDAPATSGRRLDDPRWGFALLAPDGSPRPVYHALADWARSLPAAAPVGGFPARNRWVTYEERWRVGPLGADIGRSSVPSDTAAGSAGDRASFRFDGTRVALTVRRGPYRGFLYVTVDGKPANALPCDERGRAYVVLYDRRSNLATLPLATGLEPGAHTVQVTAEGGEGRWPLVDWRVGATPVRDGTSWKLAALLAAGLGFLVLLVRDVRRVRWTPLAAALAELPPRWQTTLVIGLTGTLWATAGSSWGAEAPEGLLTASALVLSLLTLPPLTFLFALRLDLGLTLVALTAPFYLVPEGMVYRALSLPEALVLLCSVAYAARRMAHSPAIPSAPRGSSDPRLSADGHAPPLAGRDLAIPGERANGEGLSPSCTRRRHGRAPTGLDAAVLLLTLAALLAGAAAGNRLAALFELRSVFLLPGLYYALLRLVSLNQRAQRRIIGGFLLGGVGVALVGLGQVALGRSLVAAEEGMLRLQSVYHSPNSVGLYLGRVWPFLVAGVWWGRDRRRRVLSLVALLLVMAALGLSLSRGAILLAVPAAVLAMGWWAGERHRWFALALVLVGGLSLIPLLRLPRFAALLDLGQGTTFFRLKLWRSALHMIREQPLLGVGPGNFLDAYRTRYVLPAAWEEFNLEHAHSFLLDHWTRLGVLGVAAALAIQVAFWRSLCRRKAREVLTLGLVGGMAALLAHGLVDNAVFFPDLAVAFFLALALAQEGENGLWTEARDG
jgi:O-antigen ligase